MSSISWDMLSCAAANKLRSRISLKTSSWPKFNRMAMDFSYLPWRSKQGKVTHSPAFRCVLWQSYHFRIGPYLIGEQLSQRPLQLCVLWPEQELFHQGLDDGRGTVEAVGPPLDQVQEASAVRAKELEQSHLVNLTYMGNRRSLI